MMQLYSYWRSSASYRVRIALALKNIPYEYRAVDIVEGGGQQYGEAYRDLNPQSRVPLLIDGDIRISQSLAILDYLEQRFPEMALVPTDLIKRTRMHSFCHTIAADVQPLQNIGPLAYLTREFGVNEEQRNAWIRHWIERGLAALEQDYASGAGDYVIDNRVSHADCLLVPQIYNAERFNCDTRKFSTLYEIVVRLNKVAAFQQAHPSKQPDAVS